MNGQQRRRVILSALTAALAVLLVAGAPSASAETKARYPGYQGPDLAANCDALDEWEIDTATYPECGPGGGDDADACDAQSVEGCQFYLPADWLQPAAR